MIYFVFFRKDILFNVKKFWPHRSDVKGFSIQRLARNYHLKISSLNLPSKELSNQNSDEDYSKVIKEGAEKISINNLSIKRTHWANRDFLEYREVV